ncbi:MULTISPECIES: hypothetical protein [Pseudomonadota]|uniref:hypothetical protein n=1 Tax=Pseudomonadota TaxID=1224 RepID=UPI001C73CA56|nr:MULTISPECIES: hypothetical protein [Pseudomonadota]MCW0232915.1 hypothetical protein [Ferrovibrio sp.]QYY27305.1 hypothetical protein K2L43_09385 [Diaphorobacter sp. MNS-0]
MAHKKPSDPRGGHVRLYWTLIDSLAWRALSYSSQSVYIAMRRRLQSTNNGNISAALGDMKHYGITTSATLAKALRELQTVGLIAVTRQGGIAYGRQVCSLYRFTDEAVYEQPKVGVKACQATDDWKRFEKLAEVKGAIKKAHADAKRQPDKNKSGLQKLKRTDSDSEALSRFNDSDSEAVAVSLVQKLKQASRAKKAANPHAA